MKTFIKFGAILGVILIAILVGLTFFIRSYLTDEKIKELIIPQAEKHLGRDVEIGKIDVSIFKGITVHSFTLKEADGKTDFVKVDQFILHYDLSKILQKKLSVSEIQLDKPVVTLTRDKQGKFNYESLAILQKKASGKSENTGQSPGTGTKAAALPIALTLDGISLTNAQIIFRDASKELPDVTATTNLHVSLDIGSDLSKLKYQGKMDFIADGEYGKMQPHIAGNINFSADTVGYNLHLQLDEEQADIDGKVTGIKQSPDILLNLTGKQLNIDKILALLGGLAKTGQKTKRSPVATTDSSGGGLPPGIKAAGEINVGKVLYQKLVLQDFQIQYNLSGGTLRLENFSTGVADGTIKGKADIEVAAPDIPIRATVDTNGIDLQKLLKTFGKPVADTVLGKCDLHINVAGPVGNKKQSPLASISAKGTANLDSIHYKKLALQSTKIPFSLASGVLNVKGMTTALAGGTLQSDLRVPLLKKDLPFSGKIKVHQLSIQKVLIGLGNEIKDITPGTVNADMKFNGIASPPAGKKLTDTLEASGKVQMDKLVYQDLPITDLILPVKISHGKAELKAYSLALAEGQIKGDILVDIAKKSMPFSGKTDVQHLAVHKLLVTLKKEIADVTLGAASANMKFKGVAVPAQGKKITDTLNASGTLKMDKIVYKKLPIQKLNLPIKLAKGNLEVKNYSAETAGGRIKGDIKVNLTKKTMPFSGKTGLTKVVIQDVLNGLEQNIQNVSLGKVDGNMNFSGVALPPEGKKLTDNLQAKGKINLDKIVYKQLPVKQLQLPIDLKNGLLQLTNFSANTAEGKISGNAKVNLQDTVPAYTGNIAADSIMIQKILGGLEIPAANMLAGKARTAFTFSGKGQKWEIMRNALNMKGTYGLKDGSLGSIPITGAIASLFNLEELKNLSFKTLGGDVRLVNGQLELRSSFSGNDVDFETKGTIGMDGALNLPITLHFSPKLTEKLKNEASFAKYLTDSEGRAELRLKLAGTISKPYPSLDLAGMQQQATQKLQQRASEEVQKELSKQLNKLIPGLDSTADKKTDTTQKADHAASPEKPQLKNNDPQQEQQPKKPPTVEDTVKDSVDEAIDSAVQGVLNGLFGN